MGCCQSRAKTRCVSGLGRAQPLDDSTMVCEDKELLTPTTVSDKEVITPSTPSSEATDAQVLAPASRSRSSCNCCLPFRQLPALLGARARTRTLQRKALASVEGAEAIPHHGALNFVDVAESLRQFREKGSTAIARAGGQSAGEDLWRQACGFFEALLLGVHAQLPEVTASAQLCQCPANAFPELTIHYADSPLIGEFATRSRLGSIVRLDGKVCLALQQVPAGGTQHLSVAVEGVSFPALPEVPWLRSLVQREVALIGETFNKSSMWTWFEHNMHKVCPLEDSKLHRSMECLLGLRSLQMVTTAEQRKEIPWGFMHSVDLDLTALKFYHDEKGGVRVAAPPSPTAEADPFRELCVQFARDTITAHGSEMEVLAPSSLNFMRLFEGEHAGGPAASLPKITKLLSAATSWGPGTDGWKRCDSTWTCMDEKDWLGRTVREQGRVIWHHPRSNALERMVPMSLRNRSSIETSDRRAASPTKCTAGDAAVPTLPWLSL